MSPDNLDDDYRRLLTLEAAKRTTERVLLACIAVSVIILGVLLYIQNHELRTDIRDQQQAAVVRNQHFTATQKNIEATEQATQQQTQQLEGYIQCIAAFFAQPDRANLTLQNLQGCEIARSTQSAAIVPEQATIPPVKSPTTSEPPKSPTPSTASTPTTPTSQATSGTGKPSEQSLFERIVSRVKSIL